MKVTIELEAKQVGMICCLLSHQKILDNFSKESQDQLNEINKQLFAQIFGHIDNDIQKNTNNLTKEQLEKATEDIKGAIERFTNANS